MGKRKHLTESDFDPLDKLRARQIMAYAKDVLKNNSHDAHVLACMELFGVKYMHESMKGVRSYISHRASVVREEKKTVALMEFLQRHLSERLSEIQQALHPEDECHLALALMED